jgi:hypothetical protein
MRLKQLDVELHRNLTAFGEWLFWVKSASSSFRKADPPTVLSQNVRCRPLREACTRWPTPGVRTSK